MGADEADEAEGYEGGPWLQRMCCALLPTSGPNFRIRDKDRVRGRDRDRDRGGIGEACH